MAEAAAAGLPPSSSMASDLSMTAIKAYFPLGRKYALEAGFTLSAMSTYGDRLAEAMKATGMTDRAKLAAELGISVQAVGMVLSGKSKALTADNSAKAARYLKVDHYWLATGEGEMRPPGLSEQAMEFGRRYDRLDADGRAKFSAAIIIAQKGVPDERVEQEMPITAKRSKQRQEN